MKRATKWAGLFALLVTIPLTVLAAGGKHYTASNAVLNHVFRTTSYTAPTNVYIGLFSTCPTTSTLGTELSGNGYTRSSGIAKGDSSWTYTAATSSNSTSTITNANAISFPTVTTSSWSVSCFGVFDASSAGNLLYFGPVTGAPVTVSVGATASFASSQLQISES